MDPTHAGQTPPGGLPVDVVALMDRAPFVGVPLLVSVLTTLAMVFDGFDIQIIAFAAPRLLDEFGIARPQLGPILAAGLVGMAIGGFVFGALGDRLGRRLALSASLGIVSLMSLGAAFVSSPEELMWWRLATGIGLGGVVPNCAAMITEFAPVSVRNGVVALTNVGVPIGGMLGAELAARIIPVYDWRALFLVGAALPGVLAVVILVALPESPRFLARVARQPERLAALLNRIAGRRDLHAGMRFEVLEREQLAGAAGIGSLLSTAFRRDTLLIWAVFVTNIFAVYAFFNWLPTVLASVGLPLEIALRGALAFNLGGVIAAFLLAACITRFGSRPTLRLVGLGAVGATLALAFVPLPAASGDGAVGGVAPLLALMALAGGCIIGMQVCMFAVAAHAYPTAIRATGVGWAAGMARLGGIASSFAGGMLLGLGQGMAPFFVAVAVVLVPTLLGVVLLRRHISPTFDPKG